MDYKATLHLPKTDFPMKANLTQAEPRMLAWWDEIGIYKRLREAAADRPLWILHDVVYEFLPVMLAVSVLALALRRVPPRATARALA